MACEAVVVKAFKGVALNRWMVGTIGNVAIITDAAGAETAGRGGEPERSVGFPKEDVFIVPERPVADGTVPNWAEMRARFEDGKQ